MALFGKSDPGSALHKRIEAKQYRDRRELDELLTQLAATEPPPTTMVGLLGHAEECVRTFAAQRIADCGDAATADELLAALPALHESQRRTFAELALKIGGRRIDGRIGQLGTSAKTEQREAALVLLAAHPRWAAHLRLLKAMLDDPVTELRRRAAQILARDPAHPAVFLVLRDLLHSEDSMLAHEALHALAKTLHPDIAGPFLDRLPHETDMERVVIVRTLTALARDPKAKMAEKVLPALADERQVVRDTAVQLLAHLPDRADFLRTFLRDGPEMVYWLRERCVQALLKVKDTLAEPLLQLLRDPDENVRVGALMLAAHVRDPRFAEPMREIFRSKADWWIRSLAADVLADGADTGVVRCLATAIDDPEMRYGVIAALGRTKSPQAVPILEQALRHPLRGIRSCALDALRDVSEASAVAAVIHVAESDTDAALRDKAAAVLETMGRAGREAAAEFEARSLAATEPEAGHPGADLQMVNPVLNEAPVAGDGTAPAS